MPAPLAYPIRFFDENSHKFSNQNTSVEAKNHLLTQSKCLTSIDEIWGRFQGLLNGKELFQRRN